MSNPKTAIQEIKNLMKKFGFYDETPTLQSFKLEDNTILQAEKLEVGYSINKINDQFEMVTLEDGSYKIENFNVEVKEGKIEAVREIFLEAKLVDGTVVKVEGENLMEGAKVVVVTEQGEIPAPDGVHELEDGTKVQTVEGVITKIEEKKPEVEVEVEMGDMLPVEDMPQVEDDGNEMINLMKKLMEKMSEKMASMEQKMSSLEENFNAFKKEPAGKKVSDGKTEFSNETIVTNNKLSTIMALRNNNKK